jgi:outer membrane protein assembly factor BamB
MTASPAAIHAATPTRPLFPGWTGRLLIGGSLLMILLLRLVARIEEPPWPFDDPALRNLLTIGFSVIAVITGWSWVCFFSGFSLLVRRLVLLGSLVLVGSFIGLFRFVEFSGAMVPRWTPRWMAIHDRALGKVESPAAAAQVDLTTTTPADFPQFLGPQRNGWIAGPALSRDWASQPPELLWKRPIGAGWSAFSAANGYAMTMEQRGDDEWVACYEVATGNPVWGHAIATRHENAMGGIGPRSTPTIHAGRVYTLGATGKLHCFDGATGKVLWQLDLQQRYGLSQAEEEGLVMWGRAASPLIVDNLVVVPGGGKSGRAKNLIALDAESGSVAWEAENRKENGSSDQIAYASPALATLAGRQQIVIVNESTASGHDPATGQRLWSHDWPGHSNGDANSSQALPLTDDRLLLSKGYSGGAELLELKPASDDGLLKSETVWKNSRVLQTKFSNVVAYEGHLYGLSEGILECAEADSGKRKWKNGRYGYGQILGVGDLLLVLAEDGRLALVELSPQKYTQLGQIQAIEGKTWNNLCLYGNHLLVRNGQEAACYVLP